LCLSWRKISPHPTLKRLNNVWIPCLLSQTVIRNATFLSFQPPGFSTKPNLNHSSKKEMEADCGSKRSALVLYRFISPHLTKMMSTPSDGRTSILSHELALVGLPLVPQLPSQIEVLLSQRIQALSERGWNTIATWRLGSWDESHFSFRSSPIAIMLRALFSTSRVFHWLLLIYRQPGWIAGHCRVVFVSSCRIRARSKAIIAGIHFGNRTGRRSCFWRLTKCQSVDRLSLMVRLGVQKMLDYSYND
jgi:hypothetical protein